MGIIFILITIVQFKPMQITVGVPIQMDTIHELPLQTATIGGIAYFYSPGCKQCDRAEYVLNNIIITGKGLQPPWEKVKLTDRGYFVPTAMQKFV